MTVQIFLVQTQDIKQIFGLFNVKIAVRHFRFSIAKQKPLKLGTGGLTMSREDFDGGYSEWEKEQHKKRVEDNPRTKITVKEL